MSNPDYATDLNTLKMALQALNHDELDLSSAMQTYKDGVQLHQRCKSTLDTLEHQSQNINTVQDVQELTLETVFVSLEGIEHAIDELPESNLESCIELLTQAERVLAAGYQQINWATETLNTVNAEQQESPSHLNTTEVRRV